jgi:hypothetical protein
MKLLIMYSSLVSFYFIPLGSKYSPWRPVLKDPQSMLLQFHRPEFLYLYHVNEQFHEQFTAILSLEGRDPVH